jgi:hypothetical protein
MHHDYSYRARRERRNQPTFNNFDRVMVVLMIILLTFFSLIVLPIHFYCFN